MGTKKIINLIILVFLAQILTAQNEKDEVILNSGKTIKGKIIAQKPGEYIKIVRDNLTDTILIKIEDIDEMKKIDQKAEPIIELIDPRIDLFDMEVEPKKKFNTRTQIMFNVLLSTLSSNSFLKEENGAGIGFSFIKKMSEVLYLGGGVSIFGGNDITFIPVTFDVKYKLEEMSKGRISYIVTSSIGYGFNNDSDTRIRNRNNSFLYNPGDGLFFKGGFGVKFNFFKNMGLILDFGFLYQTVKFSQITDPGSTDIQSRKGAYVQSSIFF